MSSVSTVYIQGHSGKMLTTKMTAQGKKKIRERPPTRSTQFFTQPKHATSVQYSSWNKMLGNVE